MRLTKSRDDVIVSGVLAGLGEYFQVDPTLIRVGVAILMFFSPFPVIPLYIIGAIIIPTAPKQEDKPKSKKTFKKKPRGFDFNTRDFEEIHPDEEPSSSKTKDITEEDWSDF